MKVIPSRFRSNLYHKQYLFPSLFLSFLPSLHSLREHRFTDFHLYQVAYPDVYSVAYPDAYPVACPVAYAVAYPVAYSVAYPDVYSVAYPVAYTVAYTVA